MTVMSGTSQACAACKYQRRRCSADCPLALYFPPDQPKQFENAHRLFGVKNILRILNNLEPPQKVEAMRSIIYEANVRDRYPVHGCLGLIVALHHQIQHVQLELDAINAQLSLYRHYRQKLSSSSSPPLISIADNCNNIDYNDNKDVEAFWTYNSYDSFSTNNSGAQTLLAVEHEYDHEYDEISPCFDEDRPCESSIELSLKDSGHASESELRRAAACFSLTMRHKPIK